MVTWFKALSQTRGASIHFTWPMQWPRKGRPHSFGLTLFTSRFFLRFFYPSSALSTAVVFQSGNTKDKQCQIPCSVDGKCYQAIRYFSWCSSWRTKTQHWSFYGHCSVSVIAKKLLCRMEKKGEGGRFVFDLQTQQNDDMKICQWQRQKCGYKTIIRGRNLWIAASRKFKHKVIVLL
jgi:hypothetical protein